MADSLTPPFWKVIHDVYVTKQEEVEQVPISKRTVMLRDYRKDDWISEVYSAIRKKSNAISGKLGDLFSQI